MGGGLLLAPEAEHSLESGHGHMASIVGKKRGNQTYYYLVEFARVDGSHASSTSSTWAAHRK